MFLFSLLQLLTGSFADIQKSDISSKWYGEPSKLVAALFSVATKLQPCIIFVDEVFPSRSLQAKLRFSNLTAFAFFKMESLFRTREQMDHEASLAVKCQFMAMWDGLLSTEPNRIVVIGATNRPQDIDPAILRRMPRSYPVELPDQSQRLSILKVVRTGKAHCGSYRPTLL